MITRILLGLLGMLVFSVAIRMIQIARRGRTFSGDILQRLTEIIGLLLWGDEQATIGKGIVLLLVSGLFLLISVLLPIWFS